MNPWIKMLLIAAVLAGAGSVGGYLAHLHDSAILAGVQRDDAVKLKGVSDTATAAAQKYLAQETKWQQQISAADQAAEKANENAQAQEVALRTRLATGSQRVWVRAQCTAGGGNVPNGAGAADVGNAPGYAELDPATASDLAGIAADGDDAIRELTALQAYVRIITAPQ